MSPSSHIAGSLHRVPRVASSLAVFRPSGILLARCPKSPPKLLSANLQRSRIPTETRFHICTSPRLNNGNIDVAGGKSVRVGKRHLTSKHFGNATLGGQEPVTKWLTYLISFPVCLDYFGILDLPPLIQIRLVQEPEEPEKDESETG
ncbi:hypothetical protein PG993_012326 [Apiospora rasikravindrae]|uniref:Uncharacterized protein n=1 Tax=Apiospora rasikravindrae TaxID=990691 RepID=A0ABR1S3J8_9PEZI